MLDSSVGPSVRPFLSVLYCVLISVLIIYLGRCGQCALEHITSLLLHDSSPNMVSEVGSQ